MNEVVAKPQAFQAMTTDLQVSMDDVVSAFVSQYENNLFDRKKDLTKQIRALEKDQEDLTKDVRSKVSGDEYKQHDLPFGLIIKVGEGEIRWDDHEVRFSITIEEKNCSRWSNNISLSKSKPIPAALRRRYKKICDDLEELRRDLSEVLVNLKTVTRKERQVRGKIAIRKLEDSGYASLMADPELIQLVQLEDE